MSTWTGPGTWEALGKGSYPWIPRTTLNFPAVGSLRSLEKRAVRWDPEDAQDLDPWSQGRRYRKEQEERGWMWKRMRGWMSKRLYGNGRSSEQLLAPSSALPSPRWLCHPRRTKPGLSSPCSWHRRPSDQLSTRPWGAPLGGPHRRTAVLSCVSAVAAGCPTGEQGSSRDTGEELGGATALESRDGDSGRLREGRHGCHQLSGHRGSVTSSRPWGRKRGLLC